MMRLILDVTPSQCGKLLQALNGPSVTDPELAELFTIVARALARYRDRQARQSGYKAVIGSKE